MHNDLPKLELSGGWEPPCSHSPLSFSERKNSPCFVPYGDETNHRGDEKDSRGFEIQRDVSSTLYSKNGGFGDALEV